MLRRAVLLAALTLLWTFGLEGNPRTVHGQSQQDCGCGGFFFGYEDPSASPSFGPIYDGVTVATFPGQCGGYCANWAHVYAAGLCGYQAGTVAVSANWDHVSPSDTGRDHFTVVYC
jgi:hypothetical protein